VYLTSPDGRPSAPTKERVAELVRLAQQKDRDAFEQLYRLYYRSIYTLARFYMPGQAEDIVAETFLRAWGALERYRDRGRPFAAWLYAIARHIVADEFKARRRTEPRSELPDGPTDWDHDDRILLAMGLARLSKTQRVVVELKYLIGLSHQEIAVILHKSVGAVKALRWRALQNLSVYMAER
jgi:RNA polymerase sigma-70 factor (ECF subfamily)